MTNFLSLQNFDALLLQILVLTLFCPNEERLVDDGPVLNNEESGPKLVDLFTPEFCLKVGDTFVKTIKPSSEENNSSPAVTQWLRQQKSEANGSGSRDPNQLTHLVTQLITEEKQ